MTTQQIPSQTLPDANDVLMGGGGAPTAKFTQPGDTIGGRIVTPPKSYQEREFDRNNPGKGAPKFYPSGDPIMSITVDVRTNLRDHNIDGDDGVRRIYVEGKRLKAAVRQAVIDAGSQKLEVGGELHVTFTGLGQAETAGISAPKEYTARYVPAAQAAVMGSQPPAQQPVQQVDSFQTPGPAPAWADQPQQTQQAAQQTPATSQPAAAAAQTGPSPEQIAAVRAAGLDPATVFPGFQG